MKKLALLLLASSVIYACGSSEKEESSDSNIDKNTNEESEISSDSVSDEPKDTLYLTANYKKPIPDNVPKKDQQLLKEFFTDSLIAETFALYFAFDSIQTEKQLFLYYSALNKFRLKASDHLMDLNASESFSKKVLATRTEDGAADDYSFVLDYILNKLKPVTKYLNGLTLTCVAECTEPSYDLVLNNLIGLAEKTKGESDEKFIRLIIETYTGEYDPNTLNAVWFEQTWDYGGMSLLGSGKHLSFLLATDKLIEEKSLFTEFINYYRDDCMNDVYNWGSYAYSKEKIMKEINKILKQVNLTEKQIDAIKVRIKELENFKGNNPDERGLQLNCETENCAFG